MPTLAISARTALARARGVMAKPVKRIRRDWDRFRRDTRANVALVIGFSAIALVGGVGIAIDTSIAYNVRSQLASAVDAAALAGARAFASPNRDADIQNFFDANFPEGYMGSKLQPLEIVADGQNRTVTVTARANIPTFFMSVLGTDSTDIAAAAEATLSSRDVEVAMVLDVTGSMSEANRIADLKIAAKELIDIVVQDLQDPFYSKVALVPYASAVNVGATYADQVRGTYSAGTCTSPGCAKFAFPRASDGGTNTYDISSCVTERPEPHLSTDDAPSVARLSPHYPPPGNYNPCPSATIVPLSSDKEALKGEITNLEIGGSTAGQIGVAWGWYMISPNFGYLWPAESQPKDYGAIHLGQEVLKVVVIMTDGDFNTVYVDGVVAKNSTVGSGGPDYKIDENGTNGSSFDQADALCDNMKAEGIIIYTVGLAVADKPGAQAIVNSCATDADHVYLPEDGTELKQAFRDIAVQVSNLRISM